MEYIHKELKKSEDFFIYLICTMYYFVFLPLQTHAVGNVLKGGFADI